MTLEELKQQIGNLSYTPPRAGRRKEAIDLILEHVKAQNGEALLLQWLLSYMDDPALLQAGMRIVQQPEPSAHPYTSTNRPEVGEQSLKTP